VGGNFINSLREKEEQDETEIKRFKEIGDFGVNGSDFFVWGKWDG
jgi:hypothetical protein